MTKVNVIGGGVSGLLSAYYLSNSNFEVELFEQSQRLGGVISTVETKWGLAEEAAASLLFSRKVGELFNDLNLDYLKMKSSDKAKYIFRGKLSKWPLNSLESAVLIARLLVHAFQGFKLLKPKSRESLQDWGVRAFGASASQFLINVGQQGIYAGDPNQLSASLISSGLFGKKELRGKKAYRGSVVPKGGMQKLIDHLVENLAKKLVKVNLNWSGDLEDLGGLKLVTTPAHSAAKLLKKQNSKMSELLDKVNYLPLISVTVFCKKKKSEPRGFGCLFPECQKFNSLGVIFSEGLFYSSEAYCAYRYILGGATRKNIADLTDSKIMNLVFEDHKKLIGKDSLVMGHHIKLWEKGIPHYDLNLENILESKDLFAKDLVLFGNYTGQLGLSKIIEQASELPSKLRGLPNE